MNNEPQKKKKSIVREYLEALIIAGIIALFIRTFVVEAFKIPTGSMIPTLSVGDHIFVNKFVYGLRIPLTTTRFLEFNKPKRGDVMVFVYPLNKKLDYIKRVVGLPGDVIHIEEDSLTVNGTKYTHKKLNVVQDPNDKRVLLVTNDVTKKIPYVPMFGEYNFYDEEVDGIGHLVQYRQGMIREPIDVVVPPDSYFMMGDNRDNSEDSRVWGFVPIGLVKGKAMFVWLSLDKDQGGIRWKEFGRWVK